MEEPTSAEWEQLLEMQISGNHAGMTLNQNGVLAKVKQQGHGRIEKFKPSVKYESVSVK